MLDYFNFQMQRVIQSQVIGQRIRMARKEAHMPQEKLAEKVGIESRQTIASWEDGRGIPSLFHLSALCNALNCDAGYLLGEHDTKRRATTDIMQQTGLEACAVEAIQGALHEVTIGWSDNEKFDCLPIINYLLANRIGHQLFATMYKYIYHSLAYKKSRDNKDNEPPADSLDYTTNMYGKNVMMEMREKELSSLKFDIVSQIYKVLDALVDAGMPYAESNEFLNSRLQEIDEKANQNIRFGLYGSLNMNQTKSTNEELSEEHSTAPTNAGEHSLKED